VITPVSHRPQGSLGTIIGSIKPELSADGPVAACAIQPPTELSKLCVAVNQLRVVGTDQLTSLFDAKCDRVPEVLGSVESPEEEQKDLELLLSFTKESNFFQDCLFPGFSNFPLSQQW